MSRASFPTIGLQTPIGPVKVTVMPEETIVSIPRDEPLAINGIPYHGYAKLQKRDDQWWWRGGSLYRLNGALATHKAHETWDKVARIAVEMCTNPDRIIDARRAELYDYADRKRERIAEINAERLQLETEIASIEAHDPNVLAYELVVSTGHFAQRESYTVPITCTTEQEARDQARAHLEHCGEFERGELFHMIAPNVHFAPLVSVTPYYRSDFSKEEEA